MSADAEGVQVPERVGVVAALALARQAGRMLAIETTEIAPVADPQRTRP
jgi:hypothetical protein